MKYIPLGTGFSIPLENNEYGFGYVNYEGNFLMVNILDFRSHDPKNIKAALTSPLLITDWLIDWAVFSTTKNSSYPKWKLHRGVVFNEYQKPLCHHVIFGASRDRKCLNFLTEDIHPATDDDISRYPSFSTFHVDYYSFFVRAKYQGIDFNNVAYDEEKQTYVLL